jgi:selenide,water dikinase
VGVLSAALKKGKLDAAGYAQMVHYTTLLNRVGASWPSSTACMR